MSKRNQILLLFLSDTIAIILTYLIYFYIRIESGWIMLIKAPSFWAPLIVIYIYWIIIFTASGLYQHWFVKSRFDEFSAVMKAVTIGTFILFFVILVDDVIKDDRVVSRLLIFIYWGLLILFVSSGRFFIHGMQRKLFRKGIGLKNTIIVGTTEKAVSLKKLIDKYPEHGFKFSGFITTDDSDMKESVIGHISEIDKIIQREKIQEVIVASEPNKSELMFEVLNRTSGMDIGIKIVPDMYEIISGMAKTSQIHGAPLIDVMPEIMTFRIKLVKRVIDIIFSLIILVLTLPFCIVAAIAIKLDSEGPVFYTQTRVGKNGKLFRIYKFRSMYKEAESSGPIWADKDDPRVTRVGRIMRKIRFDELPQFINVLKNDMSIVGPRPERPYFVEFLKKEVPYYVRRLSVKPGITGWAQIKHKYDNTLEDVKIKLQYDFYYIENMSISLDLKIMLNTIAVILMMKGQ